MKRKLLLLSMVLALFLTACSGEKSLSLQLSIDSNYSDDGLFFDIDTNLPDGTEAVITISNKDISYFAQAPVIIDNNKATTQIFTNKGELLPHGTYNVTFITPLTEFQPEEIVDKLGENYSNYKSDYIIDLGFGKIIEKTYELELK